MGKDATGSVHSLFALVDRLGIEQVIELLAKQQSALSLVRRGCTVREAAKKTGLSTKCVYLGTRAGVKVHRRPVPESVRRNIRRDLSGDQQSLRELATKHGVSVETVRQIRIRHAVYAPGTVVKHRCETCGAEITTPQCLRCSLVASER